MQGLLPVRKKYMSVLSLVMSTWGSQWTSTCCKVSEEFPLKEKWGVHEKVHLHPKLLWSRKLFKPGYPRQKTLERPMLWKRQKNQQRVQTSLWSNRNLWVITLRIDMSQMPENMQMKMVKILQRHGLMYGMSKWWLGMTWQPQSLQARRRTSLHSCMCIACLLHQLWMHKILFPCSLWFHQPDTYTSWFHWDECKFHPCDWGWNHQTQVWKRAETHAQECAFCAGCCTTTHVCGKTGRWWHNYHFQR